MTRVSSFADITDVFDGRIGRIVWCPVATADTRGRPRSRILHRVWDGSTGWIATGRHSLKARHLAGNPYLSLTCWGPRHEQVHADCGAAGEGDPAEKQCTWEIYRSLPGPDGYDPALFWPAGPATPPSACSRSRPGASSCSRSSPRPRAGPQVCTP